MTIENLDTDQRLIDDNGRATPYFEDLWFSLVESQGGEGNNLAQLTYDLAIYPAELAQVKALLSKMMDKIANFEHLIDDIPLISQLQAVKSQLNDIEAQIDKPQNLKHIINRIEDIEAQL